MKKFTNVIFGLVFSIFILPVIANAQDFKIASKKIIVLNNANTHVQYSFAYKLVHNSSKYYTIKWTTAQSDTGSKWVFTICDNNLCYSNLPMNGKYYTTDSVKKSIDTMLFTLTAETVSNANRPDTLRIILVSQTSIGSDTAMFIVNKATTGIQSQALGNVSLELFPNPVHNTLNLHSQNLKPGYVYIYSMLGQQLLHAFTTGESELSIPTESLSPGMYILKYMDKEGNFGTRQFIKE